MRAFLLIVLLFTLVTPARAWDLRIGSGRISGAEVRALELQRLGDTLRLGVEAIHVPEISFRQSALSWQCVLTRASGEEVVCSGELRAGTPRWRGILSLTQSSGAASATLRIGQAQLDWRLPSAAQSDGKSLIGVKSMPLSWLKERLVAAWPELASLAGTLDAQLTLSPRSDRLYGPLSFNALAFDSQLGDVAGAELFLPGSIDLSLGSRTQLRWQVQRAQGQLLLGPVYLQLPAGNSVLEIDANLDDQGRWQLPLLAWRDTDGLDFKASANASQDGALDLRLIELNADLGAVAPRYLGTALATAGFDGLTLSGKTRASGRFVDGAWRSFDVTVLQGQISDPAERIHVGRIEGDLHMDTVAADNTLQWQQARVYRIPIGDGSARWQWSPDRLRLREPLSVALLGGYLRVPTLERSRVEGRADWRGAIEFEGLDVLNLTTALDWPRFSGSLTGRLPGFHFREGGFSAEGEMALNVFGGQMRVSGLNSERTFGVAPSLGADISFDNLELTQLSSVLDFGEIAGWLDGEIKNLRMLDWAPVAFDAHLRTDLSYPGKRRISQRAVQGLSSVGGGGSGVSSPMMRLVDSFGYKEVGLSCRLIDNVCEMGGLDRIDGGYTILRGAGLPRLTVVGHQSKVDWPVLLSRLQAVSSGQAPVID